MESHYGVCLNITMGTGDIAQLVEVLLCIHEALRLALSTT